MNKDETLYKLTVMAAALLSGVVILLGLLILGLIVDRLTGNVWLGGAAMFVAIKALAFTLDKFVKFVGVIAMAKGGK